MTKATIELIDQLCGIIDKSKYLILSGTMAVGKTYLANLIAEKSCELNTALKVFLIKVGHMKLRQN